MSIFAGLAPQMTSWLSSENAPLVHLGVFGLLMLGGLGFPIPEDLPLLLAGVAINKQIVGAPAMFLTSYIGVVIGDQVMYFVGYRFGNKLLNAGQRSPMFPSITPERIDEIRDGLRKKRLVYIFIGRHLFPIRSVTFVAAGALRIPFFEFLAADMLAALVSVSLVIGIGYVLGSHLTPEHIEYLAHEANSIILIIVLLGLAFLGYRYLRMRAKRRNQQVQ